MENWQVVPYTGHAVEKRTKTLIVVILDESGSMHMQKGDVVGGYRNFIDEQKEIIEDEARLALITFNNTVKIQHPVMPLNNTPELTSKNYMPRGGTALYDAVAAGIEIAESNVRNDERVLVLIMTDGQENCSKNVKHMDLRRMMKAKESKNWTFTYIGENPEAWARSMDQSRNNVSHFNMIDHKSNLQQNSTAVTLYRKNTAQKSNNFYRAIDETPQARHSASVSRPTRAQRTNIRRSNIIVRNPPTTPYSR